MTRLLIIGICVLGLFYVTPAHAKLNVFACTADWASLSEAIGGEHVSVYAATHAKQDIHHIRAKPSLLAKMRQADLVFCNGAALEIGWLPILMQKAASPDVKQGMTANIIAANHVKMLGIPDHIDRALGDVHPEGNPHLHLHPDNIRKLAAIVLQRLKTIDSGNAVSYQANYNAFIAKFNKTINGLNITSLKDMNVIAYHNNWHYLAQWLGLNVIATLEPKPGIPPSVSHLETVLSATKKTRIDAIILAPHENDNAANWLNDKTGIPVIVLPFSVGGNQMATDLPNLFYNTVILLRSVRR